MAKHKTDAAVVVSSDGHRSNARLHEQMTEGVNDYEFRLRTRRLLEADGVSKEDLDRVLPI